MAGNPKQLWLDELHAELVEADQPTSAGVLLMPISLGLGKRMRRWATAFANAGLTSLIYDPYSALHVEDQEVAPPPPDDRVSLEEQRQWFDYMRTELGLAHIATTGFSKGGRMALTFTASEPRVEACGAYFPSVHTQPAPYEIDVLSLLPRISCPVQIAYPGKDHVTDNATFEEVRRRLESREQPTAVQVFPLATHGFPRDSEWNEQADRLVWPQAIAFLKSCLDEEYCRID